MQLIIKTSNPFDFNSVVSRQMENNKKYTPQAEEVLLNPSCNFIAKYLGVDTKNDWNRYYDKVFTIYRWALKKSHGKDEIPELIKIIKDKLNDTPNMNPKMITDLHIAIRLEEQFGMKEETESKEGKPKEEEAKEQEESKEEKKEESSETKNKEEVQDGQEI